MNPTVIPTPGGVLVERAMDLPADLPAMVDLVGEVNAFDEVPWFPTVEQLTNDWTPSPNFDPARDLRVIYEGDRLIAAAEHGWRERSGKVVHNIEIWVLPEQRRQGLGRRLLAWAEARARAAVDAGQGGPAELAHVLSMGTGTHIPAAVAFAEANGYLPNRYNFTMRRDLSEPIRDVALPPGIEVRPVTPDHHRRIWDADVEAFKDHREAAVRTEHDFITHFADPDVDTSMWQVAWDGEEVAGSVMPGIYPAENAALGLKVGWLDHVSVRRPWRGRGVASALIARSLAVLRDQGMELASLGVDTENPTGALALYERHGFFVHRTWVTLRKPLDEAGPATGDNG